MTILTISTKYGMKQGIYMTVLRILIKYDLAQGIYVYI